MGLSGWHVLILAFVGILIFGGSGRISSIMGDMAKGIKSFKDGLSEDDDGPKVLTEAAATPLADRREVQLANDQRATAKWDWPRVLLRGPISMRQWPKLSNLAA